MLSLKEFLMDFKDFFYRNAYRAEINHDPISTIIDNSISLFLSIEYQSLGRFMKIPQTRNAVA